MFGLFGRGGRGACGSVIAAWVALAVAMLGSSPLARADHLGSPDLEPALIGRDEVLFFEDFEYADFHTHWGQSSVPGTCARVASPAFDGDYALRVRVPQGQHTGIGWQWKFGNFDLAEPEEIYFRYYMYLGPQTCDQAFNKLPGLAGTYGVAGWGGRPSHGDDGWSARMTSANQGDEVEPGFYCYHADMAGTYGDNWFWGTDACLQREQWHCIEVYGKMNTVSGPVGNHDGILRGWVDGQSVFEKTNVRFRHVDDLKIECIWFNVYVGGTWTAGADMDVYFDNMVIAYDYIGPYGYVPPPDPGLGHAIKYLGDGLYGVTFTVEGNDGEQAAFFANMTFEGTNGGQIQQLQGYLPALGDTAPRDIDTDVDAVTYDAFDPNYDKDRDSYFLSPFAVTDVQALTQGANSYHIEAGTGGGSDYEDADLAYIVTTGDLSYSGVISRLGVNYDAAGIVEMPLPGDANTDGAVDGADYTLWADHYEGAGAGWGGGDFNGDGATDGADYTIWADFYGEEGQRSSAPAPAAGAILAVGACWGLRRRTR